MFVVAEEQKYGAGFILQKFIKSVKDHDCRIGVVEGTFTFSYARSYIARDSEEKWIASTSGGSQEFHYDSSEAEIEIAIKASSAIGASFSESDVVMTTNGPCIIEVNPTPGYFVDSLDDLERMEIVVDTIISENSFKEIEVFENIVGTIQSPLAVEVAN